MFKETPQAKSEDWRAALADLDLRDLRGDRWSESIFQESFRELLKEGHGQAVLTARYVDAFHREPRQGFSRYEDRFSMPPLKRALMLSPELRSGKIAGGNNSEFVDPEQRLPGNEAGRLEIVQYGSTRAFTVIPNQFVFIPWEKFSENDVLGSDQFSACSAIIVKTDAGFLFAHVTTGVWGVNEFVAKAKKTFPTGKIILVRPEWRTAAGELKAEYENGWASIDPTVSQVKYPYIAVGSSRPAGADESSVIMTRKKISTIGATIFPAGRRKFLPETRKDFDW